MARCLDSLCSKREMGNSKGQFIVSVIDITLGWHRLHTGAACLDAKSWDGCQ